MAFKKLFAFASYTNALFYRQERQEALSALAELGRQKSRNHALVNMVDCAEDEIEQLGEMLAESRSIAHEFQHQADQLLAIANGFQKENQELHETNKKLDAHCEALLKLHENNLQKA
jgi:DNA repair ATPase RecN